MNIDIVNDINTKDSFRTFYVVPEFLAFDVIRLLVTWFRQQSR